MLSWVASVARRRCRAAALAWRAFRASARSARRPYFVAAAPARDGAARADVREAEEMRELDAHGGIDLPGQRQVIGRQGAAAACIQRGEEVGELGERGVLASLHVVRFLEPTAHVFLEVSGGRAVAKRRGTAATPSSRRPRSRPAVERGGDGEEVSRTEGAALSRTNRAAVRRSLPPVMPGPAAPRTECCQDSALSLRKRALRGNPSRRASRTACGASSSARIGPTSDRSREWRHPGRRGGRARRSAAAARPRRRRTRRACPGPALRRHCRDRPRRESPRRERDRAADRSSGPSCPSRRSTPPESLIR